MKRSINFKQRTPGSYSLYILAVAVIMLVSSACEKQLDVKNPNDPTFGGNVTTEGGIAAYAKGSVYWNGFNYGNGWLGDSYFSLQWGYRELMGDVAGGGQGSRGVARGPRRCHPARAVDAVCVDAPGQAAGR